MNNFIQFINNKVPLQEKSKEKLLSICLNKNFKKGEALLRIDSYCNHFYMINTGLVKLSFDTSDGEFIMRFFQENILFTELQSLTTNNRSKYKIIALEEVSCTVISYSDFERICKEDPKIGLFYNKFLTIAHINMMNRISEMLESDATTRYNNFLHQNAEIINRITLGDLSKYLGINQVTLSRIRRKK